MRSRIAEPAGCAASYGNALGTRSELQQRIARRLDCLESDELFVVLKPAGDLRREDFADLRPLLRQALVAACGALETYVADKTTEFIGRALRAKQPPARLLDLPLNVGRWIDIEETYDRRAWGIRNVVEESIRELSSTAPSQLGAVLSIVGVSDWTKKVDRMRKVRRGSTVKQLETLTARRNRIAHSADRHGQGRASITSEEVADHLAIVRSVVDALEAILAKHRL